MYQKPKPELWRGRISEDELYLHEKVRFVDLESAVVPKNTERCFAFLGYACDEGVKRNSGRPGAIEGPDAIRKQLSKLPNHLPPKTELVDAGTIHCSNDDMEAAQEALAKKVHFLLKEGCFPILAGGGHDIAYAHYQGIRSSVSEKTSIGIINFDAHFDLRSNSRGNNSGTPFFQIGREAQKEHKPFHYLCLGIRPDANDSQLYKTAEEFGVQYVEIEDFNMSRSAFLGETLTEFIQKVDHLYVTVDLDGFSSAYAPGVSAASPMGFAPEIALHALQQIIASRKLIAMDIAEMNPAFDRDDQTAKLAASLIHFICGKLSLL